jgi:Asp-tRNA(Asn)/Glu-tRNA(Gln) amidotransferase A subunit family amidase
MDSTLGYVGRSFQPASEDAVLVQILKDMGAVVIAKTNLCQSIMVCIHLSLVNLIDLGLLFILSV